MARASRWGIGLFYNGLRVVTVMLHVAEARGGSQRDLETMYPRGFQAWSFVHWVYDSRGRSQGRRAKVPFWDTRRLCFNETGQLRELVLPLTSKMRRYGSRTARQALTTWRP